MVEIDIGGHWTWSSDCHIYVPGHTCINTYKYVNSYTPIT